MEESDETDAAEKTGTQMSLIQRPLGQVRGVQVEAKEEKVKAEVFCEKEEKVKEETEVFCEKTEKLAGTEEVAAAVEVREEDEKEDREVEEVGTQTLLMHVPLGQVTMLQEGEEEPELLGEDVEQRLMVGVKFTVKTSVRPFSFVTFFAWM